MTLSEAQRGELKALTLYPEYKTLKAVLEGKLAELKDVTRIDPSGDVASQALGRIEAHKTLTNFLSTVEILTQEKTIKYQTYE